MTLVKIKLVLEGNVELVDLTIDGKNVSEGVTRKRRVSNPFEVCIEVSGIESTPWKLRVYVEGNERTAMSGSIKSNGLDAKCKKYHV